MTTFTKNKIKAEIREVVNQYPNISNYALSGFGNTFYDNKKEFGNYILSLLDNSKILDITFNKVSDNTLHFNITTTINNTHVIGFGNSKGYNQSRYMGD
jgi:hypothetical protein